MSLSIFGYDLSGSGLLLILSGYSAFEDLEKEEATDQKGQEDRGSERSNVRSMKAGRSQGRAKYEK